MRVHRIVISIESFDRAAPEPSGESLLAISVWDGELVVSAARQDSSDQADAAADTYRDWLTALLKYHITEDANLAAGAVVPGERPRFPASPARLLTPATKRRTKRSKADSL